VSGTNRSLACGARETDGAGGNPTISKKDYRPAQHSRILDKQVRARWRRRIAEEASPKASLFYF
jgi:hypothetical protein